MMMEDDDMTLSKRKTMKRTINSNSGNSSSSRKKRSKASTERSEVDDEEECGDLEVWNSLSRSFRKVQTVLDKNRELIRRANENHQSRIPDNIAGNVSLIREINGNISKVVEVYSDLSVNFASVVSQRRRGTMPMPTPTAKEGEEDKSANVDRSGSSES